MFAPKKITAALIALGALSALALLAPAEARVHCAPHDQACWDLHGPSTAAERARTDELNREAAQATQPQLAPDDRAYRDSQRQYQRELREYRQEQRRYQDALQRSYGPRPGQFRRNARRDFAPRHRLPETAEQLDNDPCGPTGGQVDPHIAAPTPGLDGATTGLTTFNARTDGNYAACRGPRRR